MVMNMTVNTAHCFYVHDIRACTTTPLAIPWPISPNFGTNRVMFMPPSTICVMDGDFGTWHIMDVVRYDDAAAASVTHLHYHDKSRSMWHTLPLISDDDASHDDDADIYDTPATRLASRIIGAVVC